MQLRYPPILGRTRGFSLVEVMVALLVISIGLLGIAKMQALALSNTSDARIRALAALEAASLAATLQADRNYWGAVATKTTATITNGAVTAASDATLSTAVVCTLGAAGSVAPCNVKQMAAYDLQQWAAAMQQVMGLNGNGADIASLVCNIASGTDPVSCMITINWTESQVGATNAALINPSYTLYIDP
jgi:type IV pilus assembly protein PilV